MNELINMVTTKTGISEEKARMAVDVVMNHLRDKLPAPLASQLNNFVGGGAGEGQGQSAGNVIGGLFGKDKAS